VSRLGWIRNAQPVLRDAVDRPGELPQEPRAAREWWSAVAAHSCPAGDLPRHPTERPVGSEHPRWLAARRRDLAARAAWRGARAAGGLDGAASPPAGRRTARGPAAVGAGERCCRTPRRGLVRWTRALGRALAFPTRGRVGARALGDSGFRALPPEHERAHPACYGGPCSREDAGLGCRTANRQA